MNSTLSFEPKEYAYRPAKLDEAALANVPPTAAGRRALHPGERFAVILGVVCFVFLATLALVDIMKALLVR